MLDVYLDLSPNAIGVTLLLFLVNIVWQARIICNGSVSFVFPADFFMETRLEGLLAALLLAGVTCTM